MILDLMKTRSSVRSFSEREIPDADLRAILEAARHSPSGGNEQPYEFIVIRDRERIAEIARIAYNQKWIAGASAVIALCAHIHDDETDGRQIQAQRYPEREAEVRSLDRGLYSALNLEEHQTKIPGTVMMLQALELGIHSTWVSRFRSKELAAFLALPDSCLPSEMLAFGYPAGELRLLPKKPFDAVVSFESFGRRG